jgi:hypothetical protein
LKKKANIIFALYLCRHNFQLTDLTREKFLQMLADPDHLASISYEELKTIVLAYPYAHNLRYLLALKSQQEDRPDAARTLATAAAYSLDRTRLFLLHAPKIVAPVREAVETEALLELKPIDLVQRELEALVPQKRVEMITAPAAAALSIPTPFVTPASFPEKNSAVTEILPVRQNFHSWVAQFASPVLQKEIPPAKTTAATFSTSFIVPVSAEENDSLATPLPPSDTSKPRAKPSAAQALAERSVTENKNLVSETMARLLAKQGYREKAIAMYEKLCLVFPERSATFAAEIEQLKK